MTARTSNIPGPVMNDKLVEFEGHTDGRGLLVSLESLKNVPFEIKRIYYLTDLSSSHPRGFHAHKNLKQLVVCVSGSCDFTLDDGHTRKTIHLSSPLQGLIIEHNTWREMHNFSQNCVIMVLASEYYDESDYIRNYDEFKRLAHESSAK